MVGLPASHTAVVFDWQEAKLLVAQAYRHTEKVLLENLDKLQAVRFWMPSLSPHAPAGALPAHTAAENVSTAHSNQLSCSLPLPIPPPSLLTVNTSSQSLEAGRRTSSFRG